MSLKKEKRMIFCPAIIQVKKYIKNNLNFTNVTRKIGGFLVAIEVVKPSVAPLRQSILLVAYIHIKRISRFLAGWCLYLNKCKEMLRKRKFCITCEKIG